MSDLKTARDRSTTDSENFGSADESQMNVFAIHDLLSMKTHFKHEKNFK